MGQGEAPWHFQIDAVVVEEAIKSFRHIGRYCPEDIVKKTRGKYGTVKKPGNKGISELLVQLDNEIKIDIEDEHVKKFSNAILKFVKAITHFIEELSGLKFKISPAGSFPLGNKIEQIDEFDFVLEWINMPKRLTELTLRDLGHLYLNTVDPLRAFHGMIIHQLLLECQEVENITIKTLIQKRFAMNLVISWKCSSYHIHEVSLDLAVSLKSKNTMQNYLKNMGLSFNDTPFEQTVKPDEPAYHCFPFARKPELYDPFEECRVDTNYFDRYMFATCDEISPNIKSSFRITKFLCSKIFPRHCKNYKCVLKKTAVSDFEPFVSSYVLKQLLFKEVMEFPKGKDWGFAFIHLRIISLLKRLKKVSEIRDFLNPLEIKNIRDKENELLFEYFDNCVVKLISWFENGFTERREDELSLKKARDGSSQLWLFRNVLIITAKEAINSWSAEPIDYPVFKVDVPVARAKTDNTKEIIYDIYNEITRDMIYVDLTTQSDMYFNLFIFLYSHTVRVLEKEDVKSNRVIEKLDMITEIAKKFKLTFKTVCSTLRKVKTLISNKDDVANKLSSIFSQVTTEQAWSIYRYFQRQDSETETMPCNNIEKNGKEISLLKKVMEPYASSTVDEAHVWLYIAIMKSLGKLP